LAQVKAAHSALLISIAIHALLFWWCNWWLSSRPTPLYNIRLVETGRLAIASVDAEEPVPTTADRQARAGRRAMPRSSAARRAATDRKPAFGKPSAIPKEMPPSAAPPNGDELPSGTQALAGSGGIPSPGDATSVPGGGPALGGGEAGNGSGAGRAGGAPGAETGASGDNRGDGRADYSSASGAGTGGEGESSASLKAPEAALEAVRYLGSFADGPVYPDIDVYVLYGVDPRYGVSVPGTDVCLEGDQLRSKQRFEVTETRTDFTKCRPRNSGGEPEGVFCPPEAEAKIVHSNHYLASPVAFTVNTCLEYDKSHCYMRDLGETELEVCRLGFAYEGIWAEGTIFQYKCSKSARRTYRHSLQFTIRWKMDMYDLESPRVRTREVYKETRIVPRCA
jgi:hypothetical protein